MWNGSRQQQHCIVSIRNCEVYEFTVCPCGEHQPQQTVNSISSSIERKKIDPKEEDGEKKSKEIIWRCTFGRGADGQGMCVSHVEMKVEGKVGATSLRSISPEATFNNKKYCSNWATAIICCSFGQWNIYKPNSSQDCFAAQTYFSLVFISRKPICVTATESEQQIEYLKVHSIECTTFSRTKKKSGQNRTAGGKGWGHGQPRKSPNDCAIKTNCLITSLGDSRD